MLRRALAIFLIVCLQGLSFAGLLVDVGFRMNRTYIAAKICVNRAKPKLNCKGKCYLNKIQKEAKEQKEANDTSLKDGYYLASVQQPVQDLSIVSIGPSCILKNHNKRLKGWLKNPFHPPGFSS